MIHEATTKASGEMISPPGKRYGRSVSGSRLRNAPKASGAPAYISTDALVISPTRDCQLGNASKQTQPAMTDTSTPNHATLDAVSRPKIEWKYLLRASP